MVEAEEREIDRLFCMPDGVENRGGTVIRLNDQLFPRHVANMVEGCIVLTLQTTRCGEYADPALRRLILLTVVGRGRLPYT